MLPRLVGLPYEAHTVDQVRTMVTGITERRTGLYMLSLLDPRFTEVLLSELVDVGLGHRDAPLVRQVVGRLPRKALEELLPPIVRDAVAAADADDVRRLLELSSHLGLEGLVAELVVTASRSDDPDVREAGRDFQT